MHLAKTIFQSPPLITIRRRVGQTFADLVLLVSQVLAMLPSLPIVIPLLPAPRAGSGYPRYRDLYVELTRKGSLSIGCLSERAREQHRVSAAKPNFMFITVQIESSTMSAVRDLKSIVSSSGYGCGIPQLENSMRSRWLAPAVPSELVDAGRP
jgi:hypothetical protein